MALVSGFGNCSGSKRSKLHAIGSLMLGGVANRRQ
jgi:hypothetical protein